MNLRQKGKRMTCSDWLEQLHLGCQSGRGAGSGWFVLQIKNLGLGEMRRAGRGNTKKWREDDEYSKNGDLFLWICGWVIARLGAY
jgi:hypothetical protein